MQRTTRMYIQTFENLIQQNVVHMRIFCLKTLPVGTYTCANSDLYFYDTLTFKTNALCLISNEEQ